MSDPSPNEIYARLCRLSTKKRQRELLEYTAGIRTFEEHIRSMTNTLKQDEEKYEAAKASARNEAGRGNVEHAVVHLMDAKVLRMQILSARSSLVLLRSNLFFHRVMKQMCEDAELGVEYNQERLRSMLPQELRDTLLEAVTAMRTDGLLDPAAEEARREVGE
jgi:hypothetical protein